MLIGTADKYSSIRVAFDGPVTRITLDRPEVLNAIHAPMHHELQHAFDRFADDPVQLICVLTGAGDRAFCVGTDLTYASVRIAAGRRDELAYPSSGYAGLIGRFNLSKPLIAAVNGIAAGGGFELALACDIVVASDGASFGMPEVLVGAVAVGGGLHRLPRQIGSKRALGILMTGEFISAEQGLAFGFVNEVVPGEALDAAVDRWITAILRASPCAVRATKEAVYAGLDSPSLTVAIAEQEKQPAYRAWMRSDDRREGPAAFAKKREPPWRNTTFHGKKPE
jgi:crotonobetainyl-CoA hydratase